MITAFDEVSVSMLHIAEHRHFRPTGTHGSFERSFSTMSSPPCLVAMTSVKVPPTSQAMLVCDDIVFGQVD